MAVQRALDSGFAVGAYLAAYWLRFYGDRLVAFLPGAWSTLPLVAGQPAGGALFAVRAYAPRPRVDWLVRVIAGVALGTVPSVALIGLSMGFEGISRSAFLADAMLLAIAAVGWRGCGFSEPDREARAEALASGTT